MAASRKRKITRSGMGSLRFAGLWAGAYVLGWGVPLTLAFLFSFLIPDFFFVFAPLPLLVGFIAIPGLLISLAQHALIRAQTGQAIRGWWWQSSLGWLLGGGIFYLLTYAPPPLAALLSSGPPILVAALGFALVFLPHVLIQAWLLRQHVGHVWLWPLAGLVSAALFILPVVNPFFSIFGAVLLFTLGGLLQGAVMGLVLLWLLGIADAPQGRASQGAQDRMVAYGSLTAASPTRRIALESEEADLPAQESVPRQRHSGRRG